MQLSAVISHELEAQLGVGRTVAGLPVLVADVLLDYFDIRLKGDATLPSPGELDGYEVRQRAD